MWRDKKIEIIEDVHIKHNPKQKEKQINKKSKKHEKKHWSKENPLIIKNKTLMG